MRNIWHTHTNLHTIHIPVFTHNKTKTYLNISSLPDLKVRQSPDTLMAKKLVFKKQPEGTLPWNTKNILPFMTMLSRRSLKVHSYTIMTSYNNYLKPKVQKDKACKIQMSKKEKQVDAVHLSSSFEAWYHSFISWPSPRTMCPDVKNVFTLLHFKPTVASKRVTDKLRTLTKLWPCQNV